MPDNQSIPPRGGNIALLFRDEVAKAGIHYALYRAQEKPNAVHVYDTPEGLIAAALDAARRGKPYHVVISESLCDSSDMLGVQQFAEALRRKSSLPQDMAIFAYRPLVPDGPIAVPGEQEHMDGYIERPIYPIPPEQLIISGHAHGGLIKVVTAPELIPFLRRGFREELEKRYPIHFFDRAGMP